MISGKYIMEDLHAMGGTPAVLKYLWENGLIHGDCMTVTGKTMAENLAEVDGLKDGQDILRPLSDPIKPTGHLTILRGNLAPEASIHDMSLSALSYVEILTAYMHVGCCCQNYWQRRSVFYWYCTCLWWGRRDFPRSRRKQNSKRFCSRGTLPGSKGWSRNARGKVNWLPYWECIVTHSSH